MSVSRYLSREIKKVDKRRTLSILGFLVILAFFPVIFSSSSQTQETRTQAAPINNQISPSIAINVTTSLKTQQASQQMAVASPSAVSPTKPMTPLIIPEEAYSPQPSIWLFIIPITVTFFTILFY